jgi:cation transport ATPase
MTDFLVQGAKKDLEKINEMAKNLKKEERKRKFRNFFRWAAALTILFECFFRTIIAVVVLYLIFGHLNLDLSKWARFWLSISSMIWVIYPVIKILGEKDY